MDGHDHGAERRLPTYLPDLTRAELLRRAAAGGLLAGLGPILAACGGGGSGAKNSRSGAKNSPLTFASWGGTTQDAEQKAWTDPFAQHAGITVTQAGPTDYGRIKAMVDAKQIEWDVVDVEGDYAVRAGRQGLLAPIDYKAVPKADVFPQFVASHGVGCLVFSVVMAYNPRHHGGRHPTSWSEFFDTKAFPGKRSFSKAAGSQSGAVEAALLADGVAPDQLYPLNFDRALAKLSTIKQDIVWWETGAQSQQYMTDSSVDYIAAWNGRMYDLINKGAPVAIEWNQNLQAADFLVVPKGTPRLRQAMELIGYALSPGPQAKFAELTAYAPVNKQAVGMVNGKVREYLSTSPQNRLKGVVIDVGFWAKNLPKFQPKWDAWLLS